VNRDSLRFREVNSMGSNELTEVNWRVEDIKRMLYDLRIPATESNIDKAYNIVLQHRKKIRNMIKEKNFSA
jgi:hypothetical protein